VRSCAHEAGTERKLPRGHADKFLFRISCPLRIRFVSVCLSRRKDVERARATSFARSSSHPDEISGRERIHCVRQWSSLCLTGCYQKCRAAARLPRLSPAEIQASLVRNDNGKSRPEMAEQRCRRQRRESRRRDVAFSRHRNGGVVVVAASVVVPKRGDSLLAANDDEGDRVIARNNSSP